MPARSSDIPVLFLPLVLNGFLLAVLLIYFKDDPDMVYPVLYLPVTVALNLVATVAAAVARRWRVAAWFGGLLFLTVGLAFLLAAFAHRSGFAG